MSSCYITISYHTISRVLLFYLFCWFDLHSILFYSILFYFISNWFDWILFNSIELDLLYSSVLYLISMNDLCLSVSLFILPSVCLSVWISFSLFSLLFFLSLLFTLFFSHERLPYTHTRTWTHTYTDTQIHMNICSFLWLVHTTSTVCKWRIVFEWLYYLIFDLIR